MSKKKKPGGNTIALNKRASHDYFIDERIEAGISLQGWEVKSLRAGKVQITESYILLKDNEAYLFGAHITPLITSSTHVQTDPTRSRKLLLHRTEINRLVGAVERKGFTLVPTALYWKRGKVKLELGIARGKKAHDKRAAEKSRDWDRQKAQLLRHK
jgi:SsrA-binding protein